MTVLTSHAVDRQKALLHHCLTERDLAFMGPHQRKLVEEAVAHSQNVRNKGDAKA